jgi:hypothetical protein
VIFYTTSVLQLYNDVTRLHLSFVTCEAWLNGESFKEFLYDRSFVPNAVEHSLVLVICVREVSVSVLRDRSFRIWFLCIFSSKVLQVTLLRTAGASFHVSLNLLFVALQALYNTQWEVAANIFRSLTQTGTGMSGGEWENLLPNFPGKETFRYQEKVDLWDDSEPAALKFLILIDFRRVCLFLVM